MKKAVLALAILSISLASVPASSRKRKTPSRCCCASRL